jgi:uncharacterized membrane-anchored protein
MHGETPLVPALIMPGHTFGERFSAVGDEARETSARLSGLISSQQVVLQQRQAAETERFQRLLTLVGTTVLVPGLVAAVFGANVKFPGEGTVTGFWAMLLFMVGAGAGSYALLRTLEGSNRRTLVRGLNALSERDRIVIVALLAMAAAIGGFAVLVFAP